MVGKIPKKNKRPGVDGYGRTALHYLDGNIDELIESGLDVNQPDDNGWSPLHFAVQENNFDAVVKLIKHGADVSRCNSHGNNVLWVAVMNSQTKSPIIDLLLENGADPFFKNKSDVSAADLAPEFFNAKKT